MSPAGAQLNRRKHKDRQTSFHPYAAAQKPLAVKWIDPTPLIVARFPPFDNEDDGKFRPRGVRGRRRRSGDRPKRSPASPDCERVLFRHSVQDKNAPLVVTFSRNPSGAC